MTCLIEATRIMIALTGRRHHNSVPGRVMHVLRLPDDYYNPQESWLTSDTRNSPKQQNLNCISGLNGLRRLLAGFCFCWMKLPPTTSWKDAACPTPSRTLKPRSRESAAGFLRAQNHGQDLKISAKRNNKRPFDEKPQMGKTSAYLGFSFTPRRPM